MAIAVSPDALIKVVSAAQKIVIPSAVALATGSAMRVTLTVPHLVF